jgi:predicted permease
VRILRSLNGLALPRHETIGVDALVLTFTLILALVTPLVFGLLPSLQASRADLRDALADGARSSAPPRANVRTALIICEVAIALVLLVGSALLVRSFARVMSIDPGFDPSGVVTAEMSVPSSKYAEPAQAAAFYVGLVDRLRALPGVTAAGAASQLPLGRFDPDGALEFEGNPDAGATADRVYDGFKYSAGYKVVTSGYFEALGMHPREGRWLRDTDVAGQPPVAVVSESFVKQFLPRVDPIGVRFKYAGMDPVNPVFTIVGVVGDVHFQSLTRAAVPQVYVAFPQAPFRAQYTVSVAVRAAAPRQQPQVAAGVREALRQYDAEVPVEISSLDAILAHSVGDRRLLLMLVAGFAGLALMLAATGIYSVLSQAVAQRTSEIGIRMALGADAAQVVRLMLRSAMTSVLAGAAIGVAGALAATRLLESFLFEVRPLDPVAFASATAVLVAVALLAAYVPARRATRVDPLLALRTQ